MTDWQTWLVLAVAALLAGAINAIAGGGTLLTFPALLLVMSPVAANATSTVALAPASLASAWGYRQELAAARRWIAILVVPSLLGGCLGSALVARMDEKYFEALVPWLLLTATVLFLTQPAIARWTGIGQSHRPPSGLTVAGVALFQFVVAVYGGYFGAGIGILMLSSLSLMGLSDIHQMNALKALLAAVINGAAIAVFVIEGKVVWPQALAMMAASIAGGYLGARFARRLKPVVVRWIVVAIGFGLAANFFYRQYLAHSS
jgi:uncharacterized protein